MNSEKKTTKVQCNLLRWKKRPHVSYKTLKKACDPLLFKTKMLKHFFMKLNPVMTTSLCPVVCERQT